MARCARHRPRGRAELVVLSWKRICCAVDLSEHSRAAFERAVDLAARLDADLTLLHVCAPAFPGADMAYAMREPPGLSEDPDRARLDGWRSEAERALGRTVRIELLTGSPAREIGSFGRRGVDVLVVGTRGPTGLGRLVLGSVAERVVRDATCPVLVVHRPEVAGEEARAAAPLSR
jgi:nucleotide-binding universal stress UspA family protein